MARLNEPPAMTDNLDTLRRKFLRQNRDIARVNSTQSLRIRGLENECARLLSENLELRSQVLRLEKDLEDNSAQRIADHAIQVKAKLETQLIELGALIAGFGLEPPTKRQSSASGRRASKPPRYSLSSEMLSPQPRKLVELSPDEAENLATQEGRLPPIYEENAYPRKTLNREEILALQSDANETAGSPELGPPPVSRLTHNEARKSMGSPTRAPSREFEPAPPTATPKKQVTADTTSQSKQTASSRERQATGKDTRPALRAKGSNAHTGDSAVLSDTTTAPIVAMQVMKAGSKRKFAVNDENAIAKTVKGKGKGASDRTLEPGSKQLEKSTPVRELKNPRSIRAGAGARKPLAIKSTNEDVSSPQKRTLEEVTKSKSNQTVATVVKDGSANGRVRDRMRSVAIDIPSPPPPVVVDVDVGHEAIPITPPLLDKKEIPLSDLDTDLACPSTPPASLVPLITDKPSVASADGRDTPPPADISSLGEMSRPSRRARASVSYAEPNLRDKMRRPTKDLVDAVAGESKYNQRHSESHTSQEDHHATVLSPLASTSSSRETIHGALELSIAALSLAEQSKPEEMKAHVQSTTAANRRKRASSVAQREVEIASGPKSGEAKGKDTAINTIDQPAPPDPYEFILSSSPHSSRDTSITDQDEGETVANTKAGSRRRSTASSGSTRNVKVSRRASTTALRGDASSAVSTLSINRPTRPSTGRKRASMVAPKKGTMFDSDDEEDDPADSSYEPGAADETSCQASDTHSISTRDRISRRRSMML